MNKKAKKLKENDDTKNPSSFFKIFYCEATEEIVAVTLDQNLLFYKLKSLKLSKQVCFEIKFVFVSFFKNDKEAHSLNFLFFSLQSLLGITTTCSMFNILVQMRNTSLLRLTVNKSK